MSKLPLVDNNREITSNDSTNEKVAFVAGGDRTMVHKEATRFDPDQNLLVYDAELRELSMWDTLKMFFIPKPHFNPLLTACCGTYFCCCHVYDINRSYLYIRQNSIESNYVAVPCCGVIGSDDRISVTYFDREPFRRRGCLGSGYCVPEDQPSFTTFTGGYLCCGVICCERARVAMKPFEWIPFPFCCCENEVKNWQNCCGFCGPITGNPCIYSSFTPQPVNTNEFVSVANKTIKYNRNVAMK